MEGPAVIFADVVGWVGTVTGVLLGLPQLLRLARTGNVEGLSLIGWQALLAVNLGWAAHGMAIGQPPQYIGSALSLVSTVPILYLLSRGLGRNFLLVLAPGVAVAGLMIGVDQVWGSAAYGLIAILPGVVSNAGQSVELVRAPHVGGVSVVFLALALGNQALWLFWAVLINDPGSTIAAVTNGVLVLFNLVWYLLRRLGLRPLLAPAGTTTAAEGVPSSK